jgi:hypothetical protein
MCYRYRRYVSIKVNKSFGTLTPDPRYVPNSIFYPLIAIFGSPLWKRPILYSDLSGHDLRSLKALALHRLRLEQNWSCPNPSIVNPIKTFIYDEPAVILSLVPGTGIVLLHSPVHRNVTCWDLGSRPFKLEPLPIGRAIPAIS